MTLVDDATGWAAVAALAGVALLVVAGILAGARWRRSTARELGELRATGERSERLLGDLLRVREREQPDPERLALLTRVGTTLDVDETVTRALDALSALSDADAAMVVLRRREEEPYVATYGLSPPEAARDLLGLPPVRGAARAVKLGYLYSEEEEVNDAFRIVAGLALPLVAGDGERVGVLGVFWRREEPVLSEAEVARFEELAASFGPPLANARRFAAARRRAAEDEDTGLQNARAFAERLEREIARARRYEHGLTLLVFQLPPDGLGLAAAGERVRTAVRRSDLAAHLGAGRFAVLLPETDGVGADPVLRRLEFALGARVEAAEAAGRLAAGTASLQPADDGPRLLRRAEEALASSASESAEPAATG